MVNRGAELLLLCVWLVRSAVKHIFVCTQPEFAYLVGLTPLQGDVQDGVLAVEEADGEEVPLASTKSTLEKQQAVSKKKKKPKKAREWSSEGGAPEEN